MSGGNNVRVVCRFRPQNQKEIDAGGTTILSVDDTRTTISIKGSESNHSFTFDRVFYNASQKEVYDDTARPVVEDILRGYNGTIFVYGQTSAGKTFTMQGPDIENPELRGIIPRMTTHVFDYIMKADPSLEFLVRASYIEIYMEKIRDLLDASKNNLKVREEKSKGIWVEGATEVYISSEQEVLDIIKMGTQNRAIAETKMNSESSRSHSLFILSITSKTADGSNKTGKLYMVDLAGSEKVEKTGATGTTLDEAKMINKSLSTLGNVINSLTDGKSSHVPYRDSKLTRVLQESLGGNSRTTLVINCSPSSFNEAETLSTLRFGNRFPLLPNIPSPPRAKSIKNSAKINQEKSAAELKKELAAAETIIQNCKKTISALEDEMKVYKSSGIVKSDAVINMPHVVELQEQVNELEARVRVQEEEKHSLEEQLEEMKDKLDQLGADNIESLRDELSKSQNSETTLSAENELLIVKLADITIITERLQFENREQKVTLEQLTLENKGLREEVHELESKVELITEERNKASKMNTLLSFQKENEWQDNIEVEENSKEKEKHEEHKPDAEAVESLKRELELQARELDQLRMEKQLLQAQMQTMQPIPTIVEETHVEGQEIKEASQLEKEMQQIRDQTAQKLNEFDALKSALFKDLENRCQKVIELEMLLDEARDQYQTLLIQVKNSNSKALQQKCIFLQRNLEQLTTVQQQLVNENNKLKLDNQVATKQLTIRNERIHGLELLLQDAQEKLQRHTQNNPSALNSKINKKAQPMPASLAMGTKIAKPIRGGGGAPATTSSPAPGSPQIGSFSAASGAKVLVNSQGGSIKESPGRPKTSIWDLFTGKKTNEESPVSSPAKPESKP